MEEYSVPRDLFYSSDHAWVLVEGDVGTIGITDYAQAELAEIVYAELPDIGVELVQGAPFGAVEAMKTVAELIAPVSGVVQEINETLDCEPRQINMDPYGEGWMVRVTMHDPGEIDSLMTPQDYIIYTSGEEEE